MLRRLRGLQWDAAKSHANSSNMKHLQAMGGTPFAPWLAIQLQSTLAYIGVVGARITELRAHGDALDAADDAAVAAILQNTAVHLEKLTSEERELKEAFKVLIENQKRATASA